LRGLATFTSEEAAMKFVQQTNGIEWNQSRIVARSWKGLPEQETLKDSILTVEYNAIESSIVEEKE